MATLKVTGEGIVTEYRRQQRLRERHSAERMAHGVEIEPRPNPGACRVAWYRAVNWHIVIEWACWAAFIGCVVYLGIFVFYPFGSRMLWN